MQAVSATRVVRGLESIIDAVAGVLAEQSLDATLQSMARALRGIVPYTSLAIYEVDAERQLLIPVFAEGLFVEETLADPPALNDSITGKVVRSRQIVHLEPGHPWFGRYIIADTPQDLEAIVFCPLIVADRVIGTLNVWREDSAPELAGTIPTFSPEEAQLIKRFASLAALAYDNARRRELLSEQARTDELTGLFNRRHFHERLAAELARAQRDVSLGGLGAARRRRLQARQRRARPSRRRSGAGRVRRGARGPRARRRRRLPHRRRGVRRDPPQRRRGRGRALRRAAGARRARRHVVDRRADDRVGRRGRRPGRRRDRRDALQGGRRVPAVGRKPWARTAWSCARQVR